MRNGDDVRPAAAPGIKFTYEDLVSFPDDGRRHELVDGEHFVTPSPNTKHQSVLTKLTVALGRYLEHHPIGQLFVAPLDVVLTELDVVEPDLLFISSARRAILTPQHVRGAPDLVVEILSPGTRKTDEVIKRKLYERFGVAEYWVVDPELDTVKIYRRTRDAFLRAAELSVEQSDTITTPLLPECSVPLAEIFASPLG